MPKSWRPGKEQLNTKHRMASQPKRLKQLMSWASRRITTSFSRKAFSVSVHLSGRLFSPSHDRYLCIISSLSSCFNPGQRLVLYVHVFERTLFRRRICIAAANATWMIVSSYGKYMSELEPSKRRKNTDRESFCRVTHLPPATTAAGK